MLKVCERKKKYLNSHLHILSSKIKIPPIQGMRVYFNDGKIENIGVSAEEKLPEKLYSQLSRETILCSSKHLT